MSTTSLCLCVCCTHRLHPLCLGGGRRSHLGSFLSLLVDFAISASALRLGVWWCIFDFVVGLMYPRLAWNPLAENGLVLFILPLTLWVQRRQGLADIPSLHRWLCVSSREQPSAWFWRWITALAPSFDMILKDLLSFLCSPLVHSVSRLYHAPVCESSTSLAWTPGSKGCFQYGVL